MFKKILMLNKKFLWILVGVLIVPVWYFILAPEILKIPKDFFYSADVVSVDNFYDAKAKEFKGEQYSKTKFSYEVVSVEGKNLIIKNTFDVKSLEGKQIFKTEPIYGINSITGEHIPTLGDKSRTGFLFAPRNLKKGKSFIYWHASSNIPSEMKFIGKESLYGLNVYKYETDYGGAVDQTKYLSFVPEVGKTRGIKLVSKNYIWIEPISGYLVKQEDFSTDYYFYDLKTGEKISPYNNFLNTFSEESIISNVSEAKYLKYKIIFVNLSVPLLILLTLLRLFLPKEKILYINSKYAKYKTNIVVIFLLIPVAFGGYIYTKKQINSKEKNNYEVHSNQVTQKIQSGISIYFNILNSGKGLYNASNSVENSEWKKFVGSLDLSKNYPGMQGFGFAKFVTNNDKSEFINEVKKDSTASFDIWPSGIRDYYVPITYLEPQDTKNKKALGYDMYSEINRRNALNRAIETGDISISAKVALIQDKDSGSQPGFLVYIPVYKNTTKSKILNANKGGVFGFVYSPFRTNDLINSLVKDKNISIRFRIYDGLKVNQDYLIFDSKDSNLGQKRSITFRKIENIYIGGHAWTIEYTNNPDFVFSYFDKYLPLIVLLFSLLLCYFIYLSTYTSLKSKENAENYAKRVTAELENNKVELIQKNIQIEKKLDELNKINKIMINREVKMIDLKKEIESLNKK